MTDKPFQGAAEWSARKRQPITLKAGDAPVTWTYYETPYEPTTIKVVWPASSDGTGI